MIRLDVLLVKVELTEATWGGATHVVVARLVVAADDSQLLRVARS
jgi:hypothetical protein